MNEKLINSRHQRIWGDLKYKKFVKGNSRADESEVQSKLLVSRE